MKKLILFFAVSTLLFSCSKDAQDQSLSDSDTRYEQAAQIDLTVILSIKDQLAPNCDPQPMMGEQLFIVPGSVSLSNYKQANAVKSRTTDSKGVAIMDDLEPGKYSVYVSTKEGEKIVSCEVKDRGSNILNILIQI